MIRGHVIKYGDNIDTDVILPGRYLTRFDLKHLARHCMEGLDPDFLKKKKPGDIIVAGSNFGCGSSRELAPVAIKAADISCIIARSFARIFYRNAINIGLMIFECPEAAEALQEGDEIEVDSEQGLIRNVSGRGSYEAIPLPALVRRIIDDGGLIDFVKRRLKEKE
ncbi:MAG: 3-isopropylmalate dehydratase small subunit [Syntrophorhabdales bacterium]|jgi:3-isopropylmalate/(R)-2-methylmalate dehydratase small subunit